jgi:hypothetical protein
MRGMVPAKPMPPCASLAASLTTEAVPNYEGMPPPA